MPLRHRHCIGVQAAQSQLPKPAELHPGLTHTLQLEAQSQGDFKNRWEELTPIQITIPMSFFH